MQRQAQRPWQRQTHSAGGSGAAAASAGSGSSAFEDGVSAEACVAALMQAAQFQAVSREELEAAASARLEEEAEDFDPASPQFRARAARIADVAHWLHSQQRISAEEALSLAQLPVLAEAGGDPVALLLAPKFGLFGWLCGAEEPDAGRLLGDLLRYAVEDGGGALLLSAADFEAAALFLDAQLWLLRWRDFRRLSDRDWRRKGEGQGPPYYSLGDYCSTFPHR